MNDSQQHRSRPFQGRSARTWGVLLGTVIVAGLAVASFGSFAGAADDNSASTGAAAPDGTARPHPQLSDTQKQCLADQGVTLPERPADGTKPTPLTDDQRAAFKAAAEACGLPARGPGGPGGPGFGGPRGDHPGLTDTQKQCLADQGVTLPATSGGRHAADAADRRPARGVQGGGRGVWPDPARGASDDLALAARLRVAHVEPPTRHPFELVYRDA